MKKSAFVCNSLDLQTFVQFVRVAVFCNMKEQPKKFVGEIAQYFSLSEDSVFLFGTGRMCLYVVLKALGIGVGDEVIIPGYTCVVVPNAVKYLGAKAMYVDICEDTLNIDTEKLLSIITPRTKAIVISHNFGIAYEDIEKIKSQHPQIAIIEDAAHALGSETTDGVKVGLKGSASFFSMEYSKPVTTGIGGFLIVNDPSLRASVRLIYDNLGPYPWYQILKMMLTLLCFLITSYNWAAFLKLPLFRVLRLSRLLYQTPPNEIAGEMPSHYPVKLSPLQACLGAAQFRKIADSIYVRKSIGHKYYDALKNVSGMRIYISNRYTFVRYPILCDRDLSRQSLRSLCGRIENEAKVATGEWFNDVVHPKGSFRYGYEDGCCPVGESVASRIFNLPVSLHDDPSKDTLEAIRRICIEELGRSTNVSI